MQTLLLRLASIFQGADTINIARDALRGEADNAAHTVYLSLHLVGLQFFGADIAHAFALEGYGLRYRGGLLREVP